MSCCVSAWSLTKRYYDSTRRHEFKVPSEIDSPHDLVEKAAESASELGLCQHLGPSRDRKVLIRGRGE